jgi:hypothetical protein
MKNKTYILGLVTTLLVFLGIFFKISHWPGAGYLLILGIFMLIFVFLPVALSNNYKAEGNKENRLLYIVTWITCFVVFTSMLFKILHWPGAGYALLVAIPFPYVIFLPVFLYVTGKYKNYNINNTVSVLFLLVLISAFSALLALNVSKEKIVDSLGICANYNKIDIAYNKLPVAKSQSPVIQKIDEALKLIDEYQDLIYRHEGITREQWIENPEILMELDSRKVAKARMLTGREGAVHEELQAALSDLIILIEKDPGNKSLAANITAILNIEHLHGERYIWTDALFKGNVQPWVHTYLDGLKTNLKLIKATEGLQVK